MKKKLNTRLNMAKWIVALRSGEGHAIAVCDSESIYYNRKTLAVKALHAIGVNFDTSDSAVHRIRVRLGKTSDYLVTFKQWTKELGIVRAVVHEGSVIAGSEFTMVYADDTI